MIDTPDIFVPSRAWGPPWMLWALGEIGVHEIPGPKSNPRIEWYHSFTAAGEAPDEVAWCSSFVNAGMISSGYPGTRSKAASSWRGYGVRNGLQVGAILVFGKSDPDAKGTGHVGFCAGWNGRYVLVLGGNQNQQVSVARRDISALVDVRMPTEYRAA